MEQLACSASLAGIYTLRSFNHQQRRIVLVPLRLHALVIIWDTRNSLYATAVKFPDGIPGNFEDFPKLSLFLDSDSCILRKTVFYEFPFRRTALNSEQLSHFLNSWNYRIT